tara:strand:+ start:467 stop:1135 length:669 start_codon:yes stop_codon:yes gene_type:complete
MKTKVIVIGGKGSAVVVGEQIYDAQMKGSDIEFIGYAFDDPNYGNEINGFPIVAKTNEVYSKFKNDPSVKFIFQLYRPDLLNERIDLKNSFGIPDDRFYTFIHPSCIVSQSASIGIGTVIMANTVVNPNAIIGNFCTIQSNITIGHDSKMGDYNFIATQSTVGNIVMGSRNFMGINSCTNNFISIGDDCFVAMGSNVIKSVESGSKVMGNPAKPFFSKIKPL